MAEEISIPFGSLLRDNQHSVYYRACSDALAWRMLATTGSASHNNLDSAIYGNKGALKLFGNSPFANERRSKYGSPRFVAVWLEGMPWALLIQGRVGAIIPQGAIAHLEDFRKKKDERKQPEIIEKVTSELTDIFNNAESSVLLDEDKKLMSWTGRVAVRMPAQDQDTTEGLPTVSEQLNNIAEDLEDSGTFNFTSMEDARERTFSEVVRRRGQPAFRAALIMAYEGRCAISGCDASEALEAAHIYPYRGDYTNHLTNGLLLRADLHTLFDLGLLTIDSATMTAQFSESLRMSHYSPLHGTALNIPHNENQRPNAEALDWHRSVNSER